MEMGAEVLATAGTPEKRDFLRALGIKYVGDSRELEFAEEIMAFTCNGGVDVILNTLPESTLEKSMSILQPISGRFIDISNVYKASIKLYHPEKGFTFHSFDLEKMVKKYPEIAENILMKIAEGLKNKNYRPLPFWTFPVSEVSNALITMKKGLHIGKLVVSMMEPGVHPIPLDERIPVSQNGTYLISGGLGGFGLAVAEWLGDCGAKNLVLVGRNTAVKTEAKFVLANLERRGIRVEVMHADISNEEEVKRVIEKCEKGLPPLKGIIHAAMVLEDAFLSEMDELKMKKVMEPKILGAWNLHLQTLNKDLEFFICFSSFASLVGNSDQGNYVAANTFLDLLPEYRHHMKLPALTVCWGPMGEVGYVAQHKEIKEHFKRQGFDEVTLKQAWKAISTGLKNKIGTIGVAAIDWKTVSKYNPTTETSPKYSRLVLNSTVSHQTGIGEKDSFLITSEMEPQERILKITEELKKEIAAILGASVSKLEVDSPISVLGFDSLMAVELVVRIERVFNVKLPKITLLRAGLNINELSEIVEQEILKIKVADLSDQEVERLLTSMLLKEEEKR